MNLSTPLIELAGIGPRRAAELAASGLRTVEDLLWYLPNSYEQLGPTVG
ncbi:MAG: hypothetical protein K8J08_17955, partial [Thermoanaerobaculia bacterium]|nr:hypothetical protein [Thermoanaerobaculia bacterium]